MKKNLAKKVTLSILAGAVLMSSSVVWAEDHIYVDGNMHWEMVDGYYVRHATHNPNGTVPAGEYDRDFLGVGAYDASADVSGGKVTISDGTTVNGGVFGGYSYDGNANENKVTISGANVGFVYGGYSENKDANGNIVTITDGKFELVCGGGNYSETGSANENIVTITDAEVDYVCGGCANGDGSANKNIVTISGGAVGNVYGGIAEGAGSANDNIVNIAGEHNLGELYGGGSYSGVPSGNVLNIGYDEGVDDVVGGIDVKERKIWTNGGAVVAINGFQTINFKNLNWEDGKSVIKVKGGAILAGTTIGNISVFDSDVTKDNTMVLIDATAPSSSESITKVVREAWLVTGYNDGDVIEQLKTLKENNGTDTAVINTEGVDRKITVYKGVAVVENNVGAKISLDGVVDDTEDGVVMAKKVILTITDVDGEDSGDNEGTSEDKPASKLNPQVLVIGESRTAATAFTNQGSELIETGLNALARDNEKDTKVFAAVYGNHSEYETGSHVNVNGWSGIVGIGKTNANGLTVGAFFENGEGNYSTHNVTDFGYLRGDGEACYNGGGFLVRKDNANGVYAEAAIRAGNLQNELRDAVIGSTGAMGYDIDTFYYGAQIGIGKIIPRGNDGDSVDVYGKFIYTHHDSEDFTIDGDEFHFDSVDSERLRLGFRINEVQTNKLAMYYGAAWEYEFGGDADNTVVGYDLSTPSLGGSTVIGEIGAHYKASDKWSFDLNGRAYVGQREGFGGSVQANYAF